MTKSRRDEKSREKPINSDDIHRRDLGSFHEVNPMIWLLISEPECFRVLKSYK